MTSHDCHSCLHITLANGIQFRKVMVMAGENVVNDVEVHGNNGAERHWVQGAIADADQVGQLD